MSDESDAYMSEAESVYSEDFYDSEMEDADENTAPRVTKKSKAVAASAVPSILQKKSSNTSSTTSQGEGKTVEEMYQKKTQLEHILLRPDTYIGSVERVTQPMYVLNADTDRIVEKEITFTPGLYKIFDEIVVNASDNKQRDPTMDKIDVVVDAEANRVSVKNNGKGIPVVVHKEHKIYVPHLIFGHLLTGSNFDDEEKKTTGGRNGYGAKLANVFSTEFTVECVDTTNGLKLHQVFEGNMSIANEPTISRLSAAEKKQGDYVKISFCPDLERFGMSHLDQDAVALMSKRAYDMAGTLAHCPGKKLTVTLNGKKLPIKTFKDYLALYDNMAAPVAYEKVGDRWEVGVAASDDASLKQISFCNAICTSKGGGHVTYIADQVSQHLVKIVKKKNKGGGEIKPKQISNHLTIFVNCLIENPVFDSQTKEFMTTKHRSFGSTCELSPKFLKAVEKSDVVDTILSYHSHKQKMALKRKGGVKRAKLTGIDKLDDANFAGTAKSLDCTLIITEGDSAKSLAMSGVSVVGRDFYGVFPLRGKLLNVRDAPLAQITKNEEIKNLVDILGLKFGVEYDESNLKTLRYGHLMIMADQDTDGSHIKGLVVNLIHHFWPSLLDVPGFLQQFITPIVKVTKGKKSMTFFNLPEYQQWLESTGNNGKGWTSKYYKGLGTSTSAEAKEYFSSLDTHQVEFATLSDDKVDPEDVPVMEDELVDVLPDVVKSSGTDLIDMVFRKNRVEDRKTWLNTLAKDTYLDYSQAGEDGVKYSEFINKEYILYSKYDNERSIPHLMDGLKPSQRKVLFACNKRKLKNEIKVAQLAGYVAEHSAYHHGEKSLMDTIVGMAQNFCGSNNVNLLTPSGQFGTRRMGGEDKASPRYIFTKLEPITRLIFHPDDDELLNYLNDDGNSIEPDFYVPVIPMVLVNGADGIGTGWSSKVTNYNPREVIANLRRQIAGEELEPMLPYYSGFTGEIVPKAKDSYIVTGKIERLDDTTLLITELPLKKWTQDYKKFLESMVEGGEPEKKSGKGTKKKGKKEDDAPSKVSKTPDIKDFKENHTDTTVSFTITAEKEKIDEWERQKAGLAGKFKLTGSLSTSNMVLFDSMGRIVKYDTPELIFSAFYDLRLEFYVKRKYLLVEKLGTEQKKLSNKARFVEEVCAGDLIVSNRKRADILVDLQERNYDTFHPKSNATIEGEDSADEDETMSNADLAKGYEYLLGMKIWSLTYEKAEALRKELEEKTEELTTLEATDPSQLWLDDLDAIEDALDQRDAEFEEALAGEKRAQKKNAKLQAKKAKKKTQKRGKKKKNQWDSDMEDSSSDDDGGFDDDSDDEPTYRPKKTVGRTKRVVAKAAKPVAKPVVTKQIVPGFKPATAKSVPTAAALAAAEPAAKAPETESDNDSVDIGTSLLERMKNKLVVSPPVKKPAGRTKAASKRASPPKDFSDEDSIEESKGDSLANLDTNSFGLASLTPATKKANKKAQPKKKPAATKVGAATKKKQPIWESDDESASEDDFAFKSDSEGESENKPLPARAGRSGRAAAKKVVYNFSEDDSGSAFESD